MSRRSASQRRRRVVSGSKGARKASNKRQHAPDSAPSPRAQTGQAGRLVAMSGSHQTSSPTASNMSLDAPSTAERDLRVAASVDAVPHVALTSAAQPLPAREREASNSGVLIAVRNWEAAARRVGGDGLDDVWPGEASTGFVRWRSWLVMPFLALVTVCRSGWRGLRNHGVLMVASVISLALMVVLGTFAVNVVAQGTHLWPLAASTVVAPAAPPTAAALVLQPAPPTPTTLAGQPPTAPYTVGAWVSDNAPPPSGTVKVFVRVTDQAQFAPVPGASVKLSVMFTCSTDDHVSAFGPTTTDVDGIATISVPYAGLPIGDPVCVTATVRVSGQTYTATTTFTAS